MKLISMLGLATLAVCMVVAGAGQAWAAEGPLIGAWTTQAPSGAALPDLPTPRANVASAVVAGYILVIGGQTDTGTDSIVNTVEVYRTEASPGPGAKNVWQLDTTNGGPHAPLPAARAGASAAVIPDPFDNARRYVAVIGGIGPDVFDENENEDTEEIISSGLVQIYDFTSRTWSTDAPNKITPGWAAALVPVPEPFTDTNSNGEWNLGEPFTDTNGNGVFDQPLHVLNGVCTVEPGGCTFPSNVAYEIFLPGNRDNPNTPANDAVDPVWMDPGITSPVPERLASAVLTRSLSAQDTSPRFIYKAGGGTGGVIATQSAYRRDADDANAAWEELKTMPAARAGHVASLLQGVSSQGYPLLYPAVFGGSANGVTPTASVFIYQPDMNGWSQESQMEIGGVPQPRSDRFALATIGNDIYIVGGSDADGVTGSMIRGTMNKSNTPPPPPVENPIVANWENVMSDIPTARTRVAYAQIGSKLYVIGGEDGTKPSVWRDSLSDAVEVYDMAANTWEIETAMPVNFARGAAGVLTDSQGRERIYVVGGRVDPEKKETWPYGNVEGSVDNLPASGALYIYDPVAKTWSTGASMPTARTFVYHFVHENKLHVLGGLDDAGLSEAHEVYDPITDTWTTDTRGIPYPRQGGAATVVDHGAAGTWVYWMGGSTMSTQTANSARLNLDDPVGVWEGLPNIPVGGVSGARAITLSDGAFEYPTVLGGDFGPVACAYDKVFHYISPLDPDPQKQNTWVADPPMVDPDEGAIVRSGFAIGQWGSSVYVAAGDAGGCDLVIRTARAQILKSLVVETPHIGEARAQEDGVQVSITTDKVVTLAPVSEFGFFYIEDPDGTSGIRVEYNDTPPSQGATVKVSGRMSTNGNGERVIADAEVVITGAGTVPVWVANNKAIGGQGYVGDNGQPLPQGLSNQGLLMTVYGRVTEMDFIESAFWIDDGSDVETGTENQGIKVIATNEFPFEGVYVRVTGVVTSEIVNGRKIRVIRGREGTVAGDFEILN